MPTPAKKDRIVFPTDWRLIPPLIKEALDAWKDGCMKGMPGSFVQSVLENDLVRATIHGDPESLRGLAATANYMFHHLPSESYGSKENVATWYAKHMPGASV
jgi:hypothetical protein